MRWTIDATGKSVHFRAEYIMADPLDLNIDRPQVVYRQIGDQIRRLIREGQLTPGIKLPSSQELAARWQTQPATVHAALAPLVREGLLTRQPKIGTFVSQRPLRLQEVGIYYDSNIWQNQADAFPRSVHGELARLLEARKINLRVWFGPREEKKRSGAWTDLASAITRREMQVLIATDVPASVVDWMQSLPVLSAYFTRAPVPNRVQLDFVQFAQASVAELKKQGCRSAGLISILESDGFSGAKSAVSGEFARHFMAACASHGLRVKPEWLRQPRRFLRNESQEQFGYTQFKEIWRQPEKPDGVVVFPDTSVPGVILSVFEQRVSVPADLKLVVHKHVEINFLCPVPLTYLYSSTAEIAAALFQQAERQFGGQVCTPIVLPFHASLRAARTAAAR
jgi:DNA-binding transcriptional regulator YhcF (GntR family)